MADVVGRQEPHHRNDRQDSIANLDRSLSITTSAQGAFALSVSRETYGRRAVLAAAYKLCGTYPVLVDEDGPKRWAIHVLPGSVDRAEAALKALVSELADQAMREQLAREFGDVRTLIVAQAFSEGNLLAPESDADDYRSDPRGIRGRR